MSLLCRLLVIVRQDVIVPVQGSGLTATERAALLSLHIAHIFNYDVEDVFYLSSKSNHHMSRVCVLAGKAKTGDEAL